MSNDAHRNLLRPFQVKGAEAKNRNVKPGQWTAYAKADGSVGGRLVAYYDDLARVYPAELEHAVLEEHERNSQRIRDLPAMTGAVMQHTTPSPDRPS